MAMTIEEYNKIKASLDEAKRYIEVITHCKSLEEYKDKKKLEISINVGDEKDFYSWRVWTLNSYDEDLLLDVMSAIKKYQARLIDKLEGL